MARPKKSSASGPKPDQDPSSSDAHDAAENEGMAHVRPDELAGSPDIFTAGSRKPEESSEPASASAVAPEAHAGMEPEAGAEPEAEPEAAAEPEQAALEAHVEPEAAS